MRMQNTEHKSIEVPLNKRLILTVKEASEYSGLTEKEIIKQLERWDCSFFIKIGRVRMVKRKEFDEYINRDCTTITEVPIWEKELLTLDEAAAYTNIGTDRLRDLMNKDNCRFVQLDGSRKQIVRKNLEEYTVKAHFIR